MMKTSKELLVAARSLIANVGWCQNDYKKHDIWFDVTGYCSIGALVYGNDSKSSSNLYELAEARLMQAIGLTETTTRDLIGWNDAPERTKEEVIAAFDKAIELA